MKKTLLYTFLLAIIVSCDIPSSLISRMDRFVDRTEKNCSNYSDVEWDESTLEYEEILKTYEDNEDTFSKEEKEKFGKLIGKYHGILVKEGINSFSNDVKKFTNELEEYGTQLENMVDGFLEAFDETAVRPKDELTEEHE